MSPPHKSAILGAVNGVCPHIGELGLADRHAAKLENEWLRVGAESRLAQIQEELEAIYKAFPELRKGRASAPIGPAAATTLLRKRAFSRKGKQAISEGMRKYWARRKAAEAKTGKAASKS